MLATDTSEETRDRTTGESARTPSFQSRFGLNAANFFLAEITGVVVPFLAAFLAGRGWRDDAIGIAVAAGGLGVLLMQTEPETHFYTDTLTILLVQRQEGNLGLR